MSDIAQNLSKILKSVYGRDVRQAIHDAIHDCYEDGKSGSTDLIIRETLTKNYIFASDYEKDGIISLADVPIDSNTTIVFPNGEYTVKGIELHEKENISFYLDGSFLYTEDYFLKAYDSRNISVYGGIIDGKYKCQTCILFQDSPNSIAEGIIVQNYGDATCTDTTMLGVFGDCTGFSITNCVFDNCVAGVSSDGRFIHAYGVFVNRLSGKKTHSKAGKIECCSFKRIAGIDGSGIKADGDGIFIQAIPYKDDDQNIVYPESKITIRNCYFTECKKRGVKLACLGTTVEDCIFEGDFWFSCFESQYGHSVVKRCKMVNTSDYTGSITSACILGDGGNVVHDCYMSAPYNDTYHPGIRFNSRQEASVVTGEWDEIDIERCVFDGVSRAVFAADTDSVLTPDVLSGLTIRDCVVKDFSSQHAFELNASRFSKIHSFKLIDYRFTYGSDRNEVKNKNAGFTYPVGIDGDLIIDMGYENYSSHWKNETQSPYDNLPTSLHTKIIHAGDNMGGIVYKEYNEYSSFTVGDRNPDAITATLAKQCLYNSRVGDRYINKTNGTLFLCVGAGTNSTIGTWVAGGGIETDLQNGDGVKY